MAWFSKKPRIATRQEPAEAEQPSRMQGLWAKCESCDEIIYRQELEKNWNVCPLCGHHMPWGARAFIVALTGWGQADDRARSEEAGFDRHLVKPVKPEELLALIEQSPRAKRIAVA